MSTPEGRHDPHAPGGEATTREATREATILHVDLDAFFASVEQRDHPELRGKPVIVGGGPGDRGVVSAASYEARKFGVHSAMPLRTAAALCPQGIFVPVHGARYNAASRQVMEILRRFTPLVEQVSIDEAFLDLRGTEALFGPPAEVAARIKREVRAESGLTVSVGVGTSKLIAKVASDLRKPDGLVIVPPGEEAAFLAPLPVRRIWGIGGKTAEALAEIGITTVGQLAALPVDTLVRRFGPHGAGLHERALGLDPDPVRGQREAAKSMSHEHTFAVDTSNPEEIERTLLSMADGVAARLRDGGVVAATVSVKIRDSAFRTITRSRTLSEPTDLAEPIWRTAMELTRPELHGQRIRLLGVAASNLHEQGQMALFSAADEERRRRATSAADEVRHRFGHDALVRARLLHAALPAPFQDDPTNLRASDASAAGRPGSPAEERARRSGPRPRDRGDDEGGDDGSEE